MPCFGSSSSRTKGFECRATACRGRFEVEPRIRNKKLNSKEEPIMDITTIRIIAGLGAVIVLFIIIWRRRRKASE